MAGRAGYAELTKPEWEIRKKEQLARLAEIRANHPRRIIPDHELEVAAAELDRSPRQVRRLLDAWDPSPPRPPLWVFAEWLIPLYYAHGWLKSLHEELMTTRTELVAAGQTVPAELSVIPNDYVTFWRAFDRLPKRTKEFGRRGAPGLRRRFVYLMWQARERNEIWQADCCKLDIWILPKGAKKPVRPWLITFLDDSTRMVMGAMLCLSQPTAEEVGAACVRAMRRKPTPIPGVWFGGRPGRILWDNGPEFIATLITLLAARLGFIGHAVARHTPTAKGKIERFFGTFQRWVLWRLPGYSKGPRSYTNRDVFKGKLSELLDEDQLWAHISERVDFYNFERPHQAHGKRPPLWKWSTDTTPLDEVPMADMRFALLLAKVAKRAHPNGIEHRGTFFVSLDGTYDDLVGEWVQIATLPHDRSFIEVFDSDGKWVCTAYPQGTFSPEQVYELEVRRRRQYRPLIEAAEDAHGLHVARAEAMDASTGAMPGLVATALSRRADPVTGKAKPKTAATRDVVPDDDWLGASHRAADLARAASAPDGPSEHAP